MVRRSTYRRRSARLRLAGLAALVAIATCGHAVAARPDGGAPISAPGDPAGPDPLTQRLAGFGSTTAQVRLGLMYQSGQGAVQDNGQAAKWFEMAAKEGDILGKALLMKLCARAPAPTLTPCLSLVADLKAAAMRGDPQAELDLGFLYLTGATDLPKNTTTAIDWFRKAADQGYVRAEFELGLVYGSAVYGMKPDPEQAMIWYRKAADQGDFASMHALATAYQAGLNGVARNPTEAIAWYLKAANAGDANSQSALAKIYAEGDGVAEDPVQAVYWNRKAAEQGVTWAAANLGAAYASGKGAPHDDVQAFVWMDVAIMQAETLPGGPPSEYWNVALDMLARRLTASQIADAQGQAAVIVARLPGHELAAVGGSLNLH